MKFVYIAGPYRAATTQDISGYIYMAARALKRLAEMGVGGFCPHLNSAHFETYTPTVPASYWLEMDMHFLDACDAILMLPGSTRSEGAIQERARAEASSIPIFEDDDEGWRQLGTWAGISGFRPWRPR